jgi:uncharacterized repeat protein (TIGR03847 family)
VTASFDIDPVDRFATGAVGEPGQRVFYLQALGGGELMTLKIEKQQVAALARYFAELLTDLPTPGPGEVPDEVELIVPVEPDWTVGQLAVAFDDTIDRMILRAEELTQEADDDEPAGTDLLGASARLVLQRGQVQAFVRQAAMLVAAGRPACPLCGLPMDPEGHVCIKTNGHHKKS